jgi:hypothetical protein
MIADVVNLFPPHNHPLTLVSDPDQLLASEAVTIELVRRGFKILHENDPVILRYCVEKARPFTPQHPVLLINSGSLEDLPYDLYQPAYRLTLSLHQYFPNLAYPVLQTLSPDQVEKLGSCSQPVETLSRQKTIDYLLREIFNADPVALSQPYALIAWLNDYHQSQSTLPDLLRSRLVERLKSYPVYHEWELDTLIRKDQAFSDFIQKQWQYSVKQSLTGKTVQEIGSGFYVSFDRNPQLQDLVPALVRRGTLQPVEIHDKKGLPAWTYLGVTLTDVRLQRLAFLLEDLGNRLKMMKSVALVQPEWTGWNRFARDWAELCSLMYQSDIEINQTQKENFKKLILGSDKVFSTWLQNNYGSLGAQRLPRPHHVQHVPHYLAYLRNLGQIDNIALIIMDGLSMKDWQVIKPEWKKRHPNWEIKTESLLAQVPTITSISRYALISGLRPTDFANDLEHCAPEARVWELFWSREGISESACKLLSLSFDRSNDQLPELQNPQVKIWCLIEDTPDNLAHNATLGETDQQSSLKLWLDPTQDQNSMPFEKLVDSYLDRGYSIFITSDHGHVEATGFGQPFEGLLAQTRGKRARIYMDRLAALRIQNSFPDTILWDNDGLLPDRMAALMPAGRNAFAPSGEVVVTHGGISIDEAIVPFIQILKVSS